LRNSFRLGTYVDSSGMAETQDAHLAERSPLREEDHSHEPEMTETIGTTASLGETTLPARMTFPGRPKEEETKRLSTP